MIVLNFDEYNVHKKIILTDLKKSVFVYPTDTIYGIGCDATNEKLVSKIRRLKSSQQPFSIIVPSKEWIYNNCLVTEESEEWIRKLPGPYTLILKLKNKRALAANIHDKENDTIGIRMPNHWILTLVFQLKYPIVTTSANITGNDFMTSLEDLDPRIRNNVDYLFYEGAKRGVPSTLVNLAGGEVIVSPRISKVNFPLKEVELK